MDISLLKTPANISNYSPAPPEIMLKDASVSKPVEVGKPEAGKNQSQSQEKGKEQLTREDVDQLKDSLNKFMEKFDTDLQFELHEGTHRMIVRFVDQKNQRVIKEFPAHELLDTLAAIQEVVGILLDKKI